MKSPFPALKAVACLRLKRLLIYPSTHTRTLTLTRESPAMGQDLSIRAGASIENWKLEVERWALNVYRIGTRQSLRQRNHTPQFVSISNKSIGRLPCEALAKQGSNTRASAPLTLQTNLTPHVSRLTHHASRLTHHVSRFTPHSPLTTHHSPLTTHHSPLTTHHSPLTTHHSPLTTHHPHGFMLIELAVAAMVIAIGVLALLGIAHVGERAATDTENETRATLFADEVFTTMRLYSDHVSANTNHQGWLDFWTRVSTGDQIFPVANTETGTKTWQELDANGVPSIVGDGTYTAPVRTNVWHLADANVADYATSIPDYAFQYRLAIFRPTTDANNPSVFFLDDSDRSPITNVVWATLHVWNGRFRRQAEPFTFYTHFADPGGLP